MRKRSLIVLVVGTGWLGLIAGQGCPGFYEESVAADNGGNTTGGTGSGTGGTTGGTSGGTTTGSGTGAPTAIVQVYIDDKTFTPKSVTIQAGQAVRWTNHEFTPHIIRSGDPEDPDKGQLFRSESLGINKSFQFTFTQPGTYPYHSEFYSNHAGMRDATVIVLGDAIN